MVRNIARGTLTFLEFLFLEVDWKGNMGHTAVSVCHATREIGDVFHVGWTHDPLVENCDIHEELVESHVLLGVGSDQVMELQPSDREHRLSVEFCVIEPVEQMNSPGTRSCQTDSHLAGEFGIPTGHERGGFLVANLYKSNLLLMRTKRLHNPVDSITREPEDDFHTPID